MKHLLSGILLISCFLTKAQSGLQIGAEISPVWNVNLQTQTSTNLRSTTNGYGFNIGIPVKWWAYDRLALQTGLTFEYMAFDSRINNSLVSSNRHGSIHLPLMLNYSMSGNWYLLFGAGLNYNLMNTQWTTFGNIPLSNVTNKAQPYAGLGLSTLMEQKKGILELGAKGRFHFIDLYKPSTFSAEEFVNHIISFDLILRYYLWNF